MRARLAGLTDVGLQRDHNEDNLLLMPSYGVVAVADGMGGHRSGDVASELAVATLSDFFNITVRKDATWPFPANPELTEEENYLLTGLRLANRRIFERSIKTMADFGMGTTIVAAMFSRRKKTVAIAHVGDSRAYRIRGDSITQLTRDHSLISDAAHMAPWMSAEEVAQLPPNVITRALGIREEVMVDLLTESVELGDVYLLCSDGLSGLVSDEQMLDVVTRHGEDLDAACTALIDRANFYGGPDNITVALARVEEGEPPSFRGDDEDDEEGAFATEGTEPAARKEPPSIGRQTSDDDSRPEDAAAAAAAANAPPDHEMVVDASGIVDEPTLESGDLMADGTGVSSPGIKEKPGGEDDAGSSSGKGEAPEDDDAKDATEDEPVAANDEAGNDDAAHAEAKPSSDGD